MKKIILMLVLSALAAASQAALYKYDGFDYAADTGLRYQTGYAVAGSGGMGTNRAGSLTYTGLPASTGGKLQLYGQRPAASGTVTYKLWSAGNTDTNLFASFILNVANVGTIQSNQYIFAIRNATGQIMITNNASNPSKFDIGIFQQTGRTIWAWDTNGGNGYDVNTSYLIVMSYTNSSPAATNISSEVWINPAFTATPGTANLRIAETYNNSPTNMYGFSNGNGNPAAGTVIYVDELRYGSTWSDVVVPEPATIGMLSLGALVTLMIRRMKR